MSRDISATFFGGICIPPMLMNSNGFLFPSLDVLLEVSDWVVSPTYTNRVIYRVITHLHSGKLT